MGKAHKIKDFQRRNINYEIRNRNYLVNFMKCLVMP